MKYKYLASENGILSDEEAPVVGKALTGIENRNGIITPVAVVDEAKPKASPLHPYFTWDDAKAAKQCRLFEARRLIGSVVIVHVETSESSDEPIHVRAFTNVQSSEDENRFSGQGYRSTVTVLKEPDYRKQAMDRGLAEIIAWKARYEHLKEFSKIVAAINQFNKDGS